MQERLSSNQIEREIEDSGELQKGIKQKRTLWRIVSDISGMLDERLSIIKEMVGFEEYSLLNVSVSSCYIHC